jgi:hypothetical protein
MIWFTGCGRNRNRSNKERNSENRLGSFNGWVQMNSPWRNTRLNDTGIRSFTFCAIGFNGGRDIVTFAQGNYFFNSLSSMLEIGNL